MNARTGLRITSALLLVVGLLLVVLAQALPWAAIQVVAFGEDEDLLEGHQWGVTCHDFAGGSNTTSWFGTCGDESEEYNATATDTGGDAGEAELKTGSVMMVLGGSALIGLAIWALATGTRRRTVSVLMAIAWAVYLASAILFTVGFGQLHDALVASIAADPDSAGFEDFLQHDIRAGTVLGYTGAGVALVAIGLDFVWRRLPGGDTAPKHHEEGDLYVPPAADHDPYAPPGGPGADTRPGDPDAARAEPPRPSASQGPAAGTGPPPATRRLRCPRCQKVSTQPAQGEARCPHCGFSK